jgi:hypothetical protein
MSNQAGSGLDPMRIVRELVALPHRGATTKEDKAAADILERNLKTLGAATERQEFRTPKTYISEVWWLLAGLVGGLLLLPTLSWVAWLLVVVSAALGLHYFDWRASPIASLPPLGRSQNIIGRLPGSGQGRAHLILMGHYDSAPVSMLYLPSMVKGFRQSLRTSLGLMVVAVLVALLYVLRLGQPVVGWLRWLLVIYFLAQGLMSSIDYFRFGFTNGAADNATGAAVAVAVAERLWRNPVPGWDVEVVLTGAEEANLKGSLAYLRSQQRQLDPRNTYVLNFDNVGLGQLRVITRTGSLTDVVYDNALVTAALETAASDARFQEIKPGVWHTGDFDSLWFARAGVPSLTLSAQDDQGHIPNLHRPTDTIQNIDQQLPRFAADFAEAVIRRLATHPTAALT